MTTIENADVKDGVMEVKATHSIKPAPERTTLVTKVTWVDNDNADGKRPDSIVVDIQKDGKSIYDEPQPIKAEKDWALTIPGVEKNASFTVVKPIVKGYDVTVKNTVVSKETTTIEIVCTKKGTEAPTPAPTEKPTPAPTETPKPAETPATAQPTATLNTKVEIKTTAPVIAGKSNTAGLIQTDAKPTGVSFLNSLFGE